MPKVHVGVGAELGPLLEKAQLLDNFVEALEQALREVVPVAFNSPERPVTAGEVSFTSASGSIKGLDSDVLVTISADRFPDREENLDQRREEVKKALERIFPKRSFFISTKLVPPRPSGDGPGRDYQKADMEAAIGRALEVIESMFTSRS